MSRMADASVPLVFADPPFNIARPYDGSFDDNRPAAEYLEWSRQWLAEVHRVCAPQGSFWLAIGDAFVSELDCAAKQVGFHKRSHVVWYYTFGVNSAKKLTPSHTHLLYYTKHRTKFTFNVEEVRVPSSRQLVYNDKRASSTGRLPDDTWILLPKWLPDAFASGEDTWCVSRVCGTFKEKQATDNQMPEPILGRIIRLCSNPGDLVFDPMAGSGTTLAVARKLGRECMGFELSKEYARIANDRINAAQPGEAMAGAVPQGELHVSG